MSVFQSLILAIIQGMTEFLPISSSAHLALVPIITGWQDQGLFVDVMIHMGSLLAIMVYFSRDLGDLLHGAYLLSRGQRNQKTDFVFVLFIATIPVMIAGAILQHIELLAFLRAEPDRILRLIAWNAILFGAILYLADRYSPGEDTSVLGWKQALLIGLGQMLALIPGVSRSGITISTARILGINRISAARFSFLLAIPALAGAGGLAFAKALVEPGELQTGIWLAFLFSFVSSLGAISFMMTLLQKTGLWPYALYRIMLGVTIFYVIS